MQRYKNEKEETGTGKYKHKEGIKLSKKEDIKEIYIAREFKYLGVLKTYEVLDLAMKQKRRNKYQEIERKVLTSKMGQYYTCHKFAGTSNDYL